MVCDSPDYFALCFKVFSSKLSKILDTSCFIILYLLCFTKIFFLTFVNLIHRLVVTLGIMTTTVTNSCRLICKGKG